MSLPADKQRGALLGFTLDWIMKRAGLSQGKLEHLIDVRLGQLFMAGKITIDQLKHSGTSQTNISRICKGDIHPSREVLELLALGLQDWYEGEDYLQLVHRTQRQHPGFVPPQLTEEDINDLFHLAGLATPAEMNESLERAFKLQAAERNSPLAKRMEERNAYLRTRMDGNSSTMLLGVVLPLPVAPYLWHSLVSAAAGLLAFLLLHQRHVHAASSLWLHAGFK